MKEGHLSILGGLKLELTKIHFLKICLITYICFKLIKNHKLEY